MLNLSLIKKNYLKIASRPSFVSRKIFDDYLIAEHKIKKVKSAYTGMCILD